MSPKLFQRGVIVEDNVIDAMILTDGVVKQLCEELIVIDSTRLPLEEIAEKVRAVLTDNMLLTSDGNFPRYGDAIDLLTLLGPDLEAHGVRVCVNTAEDGLPERVTRLFPTAVAFLKPTSFEIMQDGISTCEPFKYPKD